MRKCCKPYLTKALKPAEQCFKEWLDIFGDDYYVELQRHHIENIDHTSISQEDINQILIGWAKKYNRPLLPPTTRHYIEQEDWDAHDALLCINSNSFKGIPIAESLKFRETVIYRDQKVRKRFGFHPGGQFYFKTKNEMGKLFHDQLAALDNTIQIVDKIEPLELKRDVLMPNYVVPNGFNTQDDYLRHLCFEGAKQRYGELTATITERLDLELNIIKNMKFPGYFLIVQDFIDAAKKLDVAVGPGRGSAACSVVAYCTGITNIDPIRYNLLFERFLNPERVSMPDIDIDFDDEGRQKVIDYVVDKYGKNQVAQIITYGTMAARSAIRDVGRVLELPLPQTDKIAKLVPEGPKVSLKSAFADVPELKQYRNDSASPFHATLKMAETLGRLRPTSGNTCRRRYYCAR